MAHSGKPLFFGQKSRLLDYPGRDPPASVFRARFERSLHAEIIRRQF